MYNRGVKTMKSGNVLLGVILGASAGAIVGMLIAPAKGSVTRKRIARKGTEYAEDAKEKFNQYIDALAEEYDTVKEGAMDWVERGKEKAVSVARAKLPK
jgi:gas vesicle protein